MMKRKTKSIIAIAVASAISASILGSNAAAFDPWWNGGQWNFTIPIPGSGGTSSGSTTATLNSIPRKLFMTNYTSNSTIRTNRALDCVNNASNLLSQIDSAVLGLESPSFADISLKFDVCEYDDLAKNLAEDDAVILTFNSETNIKTAIGKIMKREQTLMNNALKPFVAYIDGLLKAGSYTTVTDSDTEEQKTAKTAAKALLEKAKKKLVLTYDESDLFNADSDNDSNLYLSIYLTSASSSDKVTSSISNYTDLNGFPRFIVDDNIIEWIDIEHVDVTTKTNDSWWFALKDGSTSSRSHYHALTRDYCWLKGMVVPSYTPVIAFGADYRDWQPYEAVVSSSTGSGSSGSSGGSSSGSTFDIYYNPRYHYASEYVYEVTDGVNRWYYPNLDYADAACAYGDCYINRTIASTHSKTKSYFCFVNGSYYESSSQSPYPVQTAQMTIPDTSSQDNIEYYYIHNGSVYDYNGKELGKASTRGYTKTTTWFSINTGRFYATPQPNMIGYFVSLSDINEVAETDPYYEYWHAKLLELEKEISDKLAELEAIEKRLEEAKKEEEANKKPADNKTDDEAERDDSGITTFYKTGKSTIFYITGAELADIRKNYDGVKLKAKNGVVWTVWANDIKTPRVTNLRVIYKTSNIPDSLKKTMLARKDVVATTQLTIGENIAWGFKASVRLKYTTKYANYYLRLYRYDTKSGSLVYVDDAMMDKKGYVTFDNVGHGGDYLITFG